MDATIAAFLGAVLGAGAPLLLDLLTNWRQRREATVEGGAVAQIVWDDLFGAQTTLAEALRDGTWWPPAASPEIHLTPQDRRFLAIRICNPTGRARRTGSADERWHDFNRVSRALRRLKAVSADRSIEPSGRPPLHEPVITYIEDTYEKCDIARRALSELSGIGFGPHVGGTKDPRVDGWSGPSRASGTSE